MRLTAQGLNGAVYALLALNADRSDVDGELEQKYLTYIVGQEKPSGGFSLDDSSDTADVDLTAMTLQCLEPYATEEEISAIIDRGVEFLADAQAEDGGYEAYGDKSSESVSQVILALSTYGIDCNKDAFKVPAAPAKAPFFAYSMPLLIPHKEPSITIR